jgi:FkbM family methyltransferase
MSLKNSYKRWLYGRCPGFKGVFPYWGERIHFPQGSVAFELACAQGIYEHENLKILQAAVRPDSWYFDIGANIGLMSAPLLSTEPSLQVVSIEASPRTAGCLSKTIAESGNRGRWKLISKALGHSEGEIEFHTSPESHSVFDGIKDTGRAPSGRVIKVPLTTLDAIWMEFGRPDVCLVKIDVEGGEGDVLRGGLACLEETRPTVLLEWNRQNLAAYGCPPERLLDLANQARFDVLNVPGLAPVSTPSNLRLQTGVSETFLLVPRP